MSEIKAMPNPRVVDGVYEPVCANCGDSPNVGSGSWRLAAGRWEHRCQNADPQCGYYDMGPMTPDAMGLKEVK